MRVIQIRGSHGTGKSTCVRQFTERHNFIPVEIKTNKQTIRLLFGGGIYVVGRYDTDCGGVDSEIHDKDVLKEVIAKIAKRNPRCVVFEAEIYGETFKLSSEVKKISEHFGGHYTALQFITKTGNAVERIKKRNGGKNVDVKKIDEKARRSLLSAIKLEEIGSDVRIVDTGSIKQEEMWKVLEGVVYE